MEYVRKENIRNFRDEDIHRYLKPIRDRVEKDIDNLTNTSKEIGSNFKNGCGG